MSPSLTEGTQRVTDVLRHLKGERQTMSKLTRAGLATVGAGVVTLATMFVVPAAFALPGDDPACQELPGKTCTQTPPAVLHLCPPGYKPATEQPSPIGTLCVIAGQDKNNNTHAIVKLSPLLCAHVVVGNNTKQAQPADLVRTLRCPVYVPPKTEPEPVPVVPVVPVTPVDQGPVKQAPAPQTVISDLPVTH